MGLADVVKFHDTACRVEIQRYRMDDSVCLRLVDAKDGSPFATATVWVPGLLDGEIAIKDWSENEGMLSVLRAAEIVADPHRYIQSGFVTIPVTRLLNL